MDNYSRNFHAVGAGRRSDTSLDACGPRPMLRTHSQREPRSADKVPKWYRFCTDGRSNCLIYCRLLNLPKRGRLGKTRPACPVTRPKPTS